MPKTVSANQVAHQIETLSLTEQIRILEKLVKHLKNVVTPIGCAPVQSSFITRQLNQIYSEMDSNLDNRLTSAQTATVARDKWQ